MLCDGRAPFAATGPTVDAWRFPLETVSQSEEGFEPNDQGTVLVFAWPADLCVEGPPLRVRVVLTLQPV